MLENDRLIAAAAAHSRYLASQLMARPWLAPRIAPLLDRALAEADLRGFLAEEPLDDVRLGARLRQLRAFVYAHAMVRDLAGLAPLQEVTQAMSLLADVAIDTACSCLHAAFAGRFGTPRAASGEAQALIVIGMGKLGGLELNVSSDIDLIFVYPEDGETDGERRISNFDFFTRLGRAVITALSEITDQGFVFRVDMRLRPDGDSGPLVANFDMLEQYFIAQGREWERYAWIKARALTGSRHDELLAIAQPFIYRKYLDFSAINSMRALHAQIRREVARRDRVDNIKLGPGGIREIEFIAQVFQLIRGGRDAGLRLRSTLIVLEALSQRGLLPDETVGELSAAYHFLRRLEHRIQYLDDAQTHMLPANPDDRLRIAQSMDYATVEALMAALDAHRSCVSRHFDAVFSNPASEVTSPEQTWSAEASVDTIRDSLTRLGFHDIPLLLERMRAFRDGPRYRAMSEDARARLDAFAPRALELCAAQENCDATLLRMIEFLETICRRAAYLSLLQQYPQALARVVTLISSSAWAARYLNLHPLLLDELLDAHNVGEAPDIPHFSASLRHDIEACGDDTERQMNVMREAHHVQVFRQLDSDLAGALSVERLSDHLSALADTVLEETLRLCWQKLPRRHREAPRFAVIAYGKLGGKELGYASDLDIVFLHDDPEPDAQANYARLAQRINTWLSSRTSSGLLFETDLRLRPDGDAGLLVSSLEAFERYQRESAWVWEHQALTRARFCAGHVEVGAQFEKLRLDLLCQPRDLAALKQEVLAMRQKMRDAHANKSPGFHLKHDAGGLIDVEFLVQYLVLGHAHRWPELAANKGNIALLHKSAELALIPADLAERTATAYRELRRMQHARRLNDLDNVVNEDELDVCRADVIALWDTVFGARAE